MAKFCLCFVLIVFTVTVGAAASLKSDAVSKLPKPEKKHAFAELGIDDNVFKQLPKGFQDVMLRISKRIQDRSPLYPAVTTDLEEILHILEVGKDLVNAFMTGSMPQLMRYPSSLQPEVVDRLIALDNVITLDDWMQLLEVMVKDPDHSVVKTVYALSQQRRINQWEQFSLDAEKVEGVLEIMSEPAKVARLAKLLSSFGYTLVSTRQNMAVEQDEDSFWDDSEEE